MSARDSVEKDYYAALGVAKDASAADIKKAYRKLARDLHPDTNPGGEERFKEVSEAYDVLSDETRRREYDEQRALFGAGGPRGAGGGVPFDLGDLFGRAGGVGDVAGVEEVADHVGGAQRGVPREGHLVVGGEDPHPHVGLGVVRPVGRSHERRLREVRPSREALHLLDREPVAVEHHGHGVAAVGLGGEDVDLGERARAGGHPPMVPNRRVSGRCAHSHRRQHRWPHRWPGPTPPAPGPCARQRDRRRR